MRTRVVDLRRVGTETDNFATLDERRHVANGVQRFGNRKVLHKAHDEVAGNTKGSLALLNVGDFGLDMDPEWAPAVNSEGTVALPCRDPS